MLLLGRKTYEGRSAAYPATRRAENGIADDFVDG